MIEQEAKFIATNPCNDIRCAQFTFQDCGNMDQRGIACLMAMGIVDRLQCIDINEHHGGRRAITRDLPRHTFDFTHEYALLFVVALPVVTVAFINLLLAMTGESGTLLVPLRTI